MYYSWQLKRKEKKIIGTRKGGKLKKKKKTKNIKTRTIIMIP